MAPRREAPPAGGPPRARDHRSGHAARARAALRGRAAWTFASPCAHARLAVAERHGAAQSPEAEAFALRLAGMAINNALPVIVPGAEDTTTVAVPIPFADGRVGALVVTTSRWTSLRPWAAHELATLAAAHAEVTPVTLGLAEER